jgi:hypothetical protein
MSIGAGIALASFIVSLTALFIATKDRWNWRKLILWPVAIVVGLMLVVGGGLWFYNSRADKPLVQDTFWGIALKTTKADVRFMKGEPGTRERGACVYEDTYFIGFHDDKVKYVLFDGKDLGNDLQGVSVYWRGQVSRRSLASRPIRCLLPMACAGSTRMRTITRHS